MKLVVKIGGAALEVKGLLDQCAHSIAGLAQDGHQIALIHGGGAALTRTLAQMGKESSFINGLRITDSETRDVALMVLAGAMNKRVVAAVAAAGQPAVGMCGGDGLAFRARKKTSAVDLGFVGEIVTVDSRWISAIWQAGFVPAIASIALGTDGEYYNINADDMAAACAVACHADALIFLTDVPGVKDNAGTVIRWLELQQIPLLVKDAVIRGGMLPKLDACRYALRHGVGRVRILPAASAGELPGFHHWKIEGGTEVVA